VADVTSHTLNNSSEECSGPVARVSARGSDDLMATAALVYRGRGRCQGVRNIRQGHLPSYGCGVGRPSHDRRDGRVGHHAAVPARDGLGLTPIPAPNTLAIAPHRAAGSPARSGRTPYSVAHFVAQPRGSAPSVQRNPAWSLVGPPGLGHPCETATFSARGGTQGAPHEHPRTRR
jgi:hypothetical protein